MNVRDMDVLGEELNRSDFGLDEQKFPAPGQTSRPPRDQSRECSTRQTWPMPLLILLSIALHASLLLLPPSFSSSPPVIVELHLGMSEPPGAGALVGDDDGPETGRRPKDDVETPEGQASREQKTPPAPPSSTAPRREAERAVPGATGKKNAPVRRNKPPIPVQSTPQNTSIAKKQDIRTTPPASLAPTIQTPRSISTPEDTPVPMQESGQIKGYGGLPNGGTAPGPGTDEINGSSPLPFGKDGGPTFARRATPQYPRLSLARREQGTVVLLLHLDARGGLDTVQVIRSSGPRLDAAALEAARSSTYHPACVDGKKLPCKAVLPIHFALKD